MKKGIRFVLLILLLPLLYVIVVLAIAQANYYQPKDEEILLENSKISLLTDSTFTVLNWNIGYAGLGENADFFFDGGKSTRSQQSDVKKYWAGIQNYIQQQNVDFTFLQEVDVNSKRSYGINQKAYFEENLPNTIFATNYKVKYIPLQWLKPMGNVHSGLLISSRTIPMVAKRIQYPGEYSFPNKLFFLRRCHIQERFLLGGGTPEQLVMMNTHLSAYDDGEMKQQEMAKLKEILVNEYNKGNFVVVGGDFNQAFDAEEIKSFLPDWTVAADKSTPTNRDLSTAYHANSKTGIIDYFLVSPNVEVLSVKTDDLKFSFSDHQPVKLTFKIKK